MKFFNLLLLLGISYGALAQNELSVQLIDSVLLKADRFEGVDDFENIYYTKGNTLYKKTHLQTYSYTNTQLGNVTSVDITNPLKVVLFYRDFNTVVILDNRLNELSDRINFNEVSYAKNAMFATVSSNNNLWLYSLEDNIVSLWNYETKTTIFDSQPLPFYSTEFEATMQISTYEDCWLVSNTGLLHFNEYGAFIGAHEISGIVAVRPYEDQLIYIKDNEVAFFKASVPFKINGFNPEHLSTNFFVNKNTFYFLRSNRLYRYRILKN